MKTHYSRRFVMAATILAAALPLSFNIRAAAQAETTATGTGAQITIAPTATYYWVSGNKAKFQEDMGQRAGASAGIQDFNYTKQIDDKTRVNFDGRAIFGNEDYLLHFNIQKDDWFKVDFGYKQFFTPYDGDGGYFTYGGKSAFGSNMASISNQMGITRGDFWVDIKTLFPKGPSFTLHYDRASRYGDTPSTSMNSVATGTPLPTSIGGVTINNGNSANRGIAPAYWYVNEATDNFSLDLDQQLKSFRYGAGVFGQHQTTENAIYYVSGTAKPGNPNLGQTNGAGYNTTTDLFGAHVYALGNISKTITYGASALYDQFEYDINSGGRFNYGGTEQIYDPISRAVSPNGTTPVTNGVNNLFGETTYKEWSASANLNWRPTKNWSIVPSISFEDYRTDAMADYNTAAFGVSAPPTSLTNSNNNWFQSTEKLEILYTGIQNMTHTLAAEFNQGTGSNYFGTLGNAAALASGVPSVYTTTNQTSYTEKISYTGNWYVKPGLSLSGQYYYKLDRNYYDTPWATDSTNGGTTGTGPRYPGYINSQGFETHDFNLRLTWRPISWIASVTRYDFQYSTIDTGYGNSGIPGTVTDNYYATMLLRKTQSGKTRAQIISESLTLTPHPRVSISLNGSAVFDQTVQPQFVYVASNLMNQNVGALQTIQYASANQTIINSDNNYFNAGFNIYYAATDLDDVSLDYNYYKAWNGTSNPIASTPYGANEHQYIITLGWTRRFATPNLQFNLGYTYIGYKNASMGGNLDYRANGITGTLRYKF